LEFLVKHHIFGLSKKFPKVISKPKPKVENDLEIEKIPKYLILEFLVKPGFLDFPKSFQK
jgi:hypothetical protein